MLLCFQYRKLSLPVINFITKSNQGKNGFILSYSFTGLYQMRSGQELEAETMEESCLLACLSSAAFPFSFLPSFFYFCSYFFFLFIQSCFFSYTIYPDYIFPSLCVSSFFPLNSSYGDPIFSCFSLENNRLLIDNHKI